MAFGLWESIELFPKPVGRSLTRTPATILVRVTRIRERKDVEAEWVRCLTDTQRLQNLTYSALGQSEPLHTWRVPARISIAAARRSSTHASTRPCLVRKLSTHTLPT